MERTSVADCVSKVGETVFLQGFAENVRLMGKVAFVDLRDRTGKIQCVIVQKGNENYSEEVKNTTIESVIELTGIIKARPQNQIVSDSITGGIELEISEFKVLSRAEALPIQVNDKGQNEAEQDIRLDYRWLDLRKPNKLLVFEIWTYLEKVMRNYVLEKNFIEIKSPKLLGAPSESGAEVFEVEYFEGKAYLAQSPQFYKQMAMAAGFEKVFEIGPAFRAENSLTIRHMTEFTSYDFEFSYIKSFQDVIKFEEEMLRYVFEKVGEKYGKVIKGVYGVDFTIPTTPFPQIELAEVKKILASKGIASEKDWDLSSEEERELGKYIKEKYNHDFVFLIQYPEKGRAFYHMRDENGFAQGFDLVYKGLEITTGAQREHRYDVLMSQAKLRGMNTENLKFYLDFFRFGCPPHGGLAIGPSRLIMKMLGLENIREAVFLFRNPKRLNP